MENKQELLQRMKAYPAKLDEIEQAERELRSSVGLYWGMARWELGRNDFDGRKAHIPQGCEAYTIEGFEDVPHDVTAEDAAIEWTVITVLALCNNTLSFKLTDGERIIYVPAEHITLA